MNELADVSVVAAELSAAYSRMAEWYRDQLHLTPADAAAKARELGADLDSRPADQVSWFALSTLAEQNPDKAYAVWQRVKAEARAELDSGHRAARTLESFGAETWKRAQFLAIRDSFVEEWKPTGGIEQALIDTLAQAHACYLFWLDTLNSHTTIEASRWDKDIKDYGGWAPPRVSDQVAIDSAAAMVDRFNRLFLRTLRQLRDLRRYASAVTIQTAGQVNIGQQQVNVAGQP